MVRRRRGRRGGGGHLAGKFQVQMYAVRPWDQKMRQEFKLPGDPYEGDREAIEYLRELGVVFYRDQDHADAVLIQPDDEDQTPITERRGWLGYKVSCVLMKGTREIADWDKPDERHIRKYGDAKAWVHWNVACHVQELDEQKVIAA